jgi:hypothetical protein
VGVVVESQVAARGLDRGREPAARVRNLVILGLFGLLSGTLTWLVITFVWEPYIGLDWQLKLAGWELSFTHLTLAPGLLFGVIVGWFLWRRRLARPWQALAYTAAAILSNFIATNLAAHLVDLIDSAVLLGMLAGLVGAACLTTLSLPLFGFVRRPVPCLLMLAAGMLLGGLLEPAMEGSGDHGLGFLLLYAVWQAGYAAALGTALPVRQP